MAGSVNKVFLVGRVGRDPEIRRVGSTGDRIANISLATSESWRDKSTGERKENTQWHRIVVMSDKLAEVVEKYVRKGSLLNVIGSLETRKWTDKDGVERYSTEVVVRGFGGELTLLDSAKDGGSDDASRPSESHSTGAAARPRAGADIDDDVPF